MPRKLIAKALMMLAVAGTSGGASPSPYTPATPPCEADGILRSVVGRFAAYTPRVVGYPIAIRNLSHVRENRLELRSSFWPVERRYCHAQVVTSDGRPRDLWYLIESTFGFAGLGSSVTFCVSGLDPWYVNGTNCRSVR